MCVMKDQILMNYVTAQHVFLINLSNYVVDITIPKNN
jgi:hypothetical protein